jgi:malonyl-CoA/methylmalonyl-CoA synthetase
MRLLERFDATNIAAEFDEFLPSLFFGVPTMYVRLLELERGVAERIGNSMRLFVSGSAPLPAHVHHAVHAAFGHWVLERYGMSETLMNCCNPYVGERRAGSVGPPLPGVSVRIVDEHMRDVPNGVVGEVLVRGPNVFQGYWRLPDASASAFVDGWFRTGDLGEQSDDGYLTLRGRRSEVIISAGFNIYPREIEEVLLEIPGVREAAIVSAPDDRRGEIPVAYIVAETLVSDAALADHCRRHLASFKLPRAFVRLDALPRTALGKIQKQLLPPFSSTDVMT